VILRTESGSSLDIISQLGFIMEMCCVFCEVQNEFLNIIWTDFRWPILGFGIYIFMHCLIPGPCIHSVAYPYFSNLEILLCSPLHLWLSSTCALILGQAGIHVVDWNREASSLLGQLVKTWVCMPTGLFCLFILNLLRISLAPGHEADHSPPSDAKVKNGGAIPPLPHVSLWHSA
jgi:hypothetical protein